MDKTPNSAEAVFAEAVELPPGQARDRLLTERCGDNAALHCEVASLLRAHDGAGDFLQPPPRLTVQLEITPKASSGTVLMNAALHADAFLRGFPRRPAMFRTARPGVRRLQSGQP